MTMKNGTWKTITVICGGVILVGGAFGYFSGVFNFIYRANDTITIVQGEKKGEEEIGNRFMSKSIDKMQTKLDKIYEYTVPADVRAREERVNRTRRIDR